MIPSAQIWRNLIIGGKQSTNFYYEMLIITNKCYETVFVNFVLEKKFSFY